MTTSDWPLCRFHAPRWVFPGDEVDVGVDLLCDVEIDVDKIELYVVAKNGLGAVRADDWMTGELTTKHEKRTFTAVLPLSGRTKLLKGSTVFPTKFVVPEDTPPSHAFGGAFAYLGMEVRVFFDKDKQYLYWCWTRVRPRKHPLTRAPIQRAAAGLEISIASSEIASGEAIEGACVARALGDRAANVHLDLVAELTVPKMPVQKFVAAHTTFSLPPGAAGLAVPFRFRVPEVMPSFSTSSHTLVWQLHARRPALLRSGAPLAIPLTVVDTLLANEMPLPTAIPAIGDPRIARSFEEYASGGWTLIDRVFIDESLGTLRPVIKAKSGDGELAIALAYRRDGMFLVARASYPRLGLDLRAQRGRRLLAGDIEVGVPAWDPGHHLLARSEPQALPFARAVVDVLVTMPYLGDLASWSDEEIVFARRVRTVERGDLEIVNRDLALLAAAIAQARKQIVPPVGDSIADLDAWRAYVRELRGTLTDGDLSFDGALGSYPVTVRVHWQRNRASEVDISIGDAATASDDARAVFVESAHPIAETTGLATRASWLPDIVDLLVEEGVASARWKVTAGILDVTRVRALVESLHLIRRGLDVEIGPYR